MNSKSASIGHIAAFFTIIIWGTTFIATKVLLRVLTPVEILFYRFFLGYLVLWLVAPKNLKLDNRKQELYFMAAGLLGVTLYFLLENLALTFTLAANVGVIIAIAPFFTALFDYFFLHGERWRSRAFASLASAVTIQYSSTLQVICLPSPPLSSGPVTQPSPKKSALLATEPS